MTGSVVELATSCAVAVYAGERFLGSGFTVAPGQVLTCAHVASGEGSGPLTVRSAGKAHAASRVRLIPPQAEPGRQRTYAPPDLALITLDGRPDLPVAWLATRGPEAGKDVLCLGFSGATTEDETAPDSFVVQAAAASGGGFTRVQRGEIPHGMSGGLVLDLSTNRVCGVVKTSQDPRAPRGGWIIPVPLIASHLGDVVEQNAACHGPTSPWRQLATSHGKFAQQIFQAPLSAASLAVNPPPSWWLDPRHRATRFQERPELESLLAWAASEDPGTPVARLVTGEGGSGKTRLAVELAARLTADGWIAGILTADDLPRLPLIPGVLHEALAHGHRVFIALDYPEGMGDELSRFLARLPLPDEGTVRVLLLARFGGEWWDTLHPAGDVKYLIDAVPLQLTPLNPDPGTTADRFGEALHDYRLRILGPGAAGDERPAVPAALAEAALKHAAAIKLHALALVSVLHEREHGGLPGGEVAWTDPLKALVNHERRHWVEAARGQGLPFAGDPGWTGRILLVPTLLAAYHLEAASTAISRIPGFAERFPGAAQDAAALLRELYPPDESSSLRWWSPLPLDRLGETLLAAVLERLAEDEAVAYVTGAMRAASLPEAAQGLIVLTRLSAAPDAAGTLHAKVSRCLDALAAAEQSRLLPALLVAGRQLPPGARRPGEDYLSRLDPVSAMNLVQLLNQTSVPRLFRETGLLLLDHVDRILKSDQVWLEDAPGPARELTARLRAAGTGFPASGLSYFLAKALRAELLVHLGRPGEAIGPAEAAVRAMRAARLASGRGGTSYGGTRPFLMVLGIYADALHTVGRLAESAEVRQERVTVLQQAAAEGAPGTGQDMVTLLGELAGALLEAGQPERAEPWAREAAERARALPSAHEQAAALALWAQALDQAGRTADARAIAQDSARVLQQDAGLTVSRSAAARIIGDLGRLAPAGTPAPDLLAELREAAARDPAAVTPAVVSAALTRAGRLAALGDLQGAGIHMAEAISQARRLAADDPDSYLSVLASVLVHSADYGCGPDAAADAAEAVNTYRRMADQRGRDDVRPDLALALMQQALMLRDAGRDAGSLPDLAEAIAILRPLVPQDPSRNTPYLCTALGLFAETAARHGDSQEAVTAAREAIALTITRTDDRPPEPASELRQFRRVLLTALAGLMRERSHQGAPPAAMVGIAAEMIEAAHLLPATALSDDDRKLLAGLLGMVSAFHRDNGRIKDAVPLMAEALATLRSTADVLRGEPGSPLLFRTGVGLIGLYKSLGWHTDAARTAAEVLADCRRVQSGWEEQRYDCLLMAKEVIAELPRPASTAEALRLATALAQTGREWQPRKGLERALGLAGVLQLTEVLAEAARNGTAPDDRPAAALEVAAGAELLAGRPDLLRTQHAHGVALAATELQAAGQTDEALQLSTRAVELHQLLAARRNDLDPLPRIAALYQQGVLLSAVGRPGDAIEPLEKALPDLLASGKGIPATRWMLLRNIVDLLRQDYRAVGRDDAEQSLVAALSTSGIPLEAAALRRSEAPDGDRRSALRAAEDKAAADPGHAVAEFRKLLVTASGAGEYLTIRDSCLRAVPKLTGAGRFPEALHLCDLLVTAGGSVGLGKWAEIDGRSRQLHLRLEAGMDPGAILSEAAALTAKIEQLTTEPGTGHGMDLVWARETLLRVSAASALLLGQWAGALRFSQERADAMRERGAPPSDVAYAELNSFTALLRAGRAAEAEELLDRCESAFRQEPAEQDLHLGLAAHARAELAARAGDPQRAVELGSQALARLYQSRDVTQIRHGHEALGRWHGEADLHSSLELVHVLAAAVLAELAGHAPDIHPVRRALFLRAGDHPPTAAALCAITDATQGVRLAELTEQLSRARDAVTPDQVMLGLVQRARDSQLLMFQKLAEYRMLWDPVIAAITMARQGDLDAAAAVGRALGAYADDEDWSQLASALGHIFRYRSRAAAALSLDEADAVLLRRCTDALDGLVHVDPELAYALPFSSVLSAVVFSVQNGEVSPVIARKLEEVAETKRWRPLVDAIRKILAGERGSQITSGLDHVNAVIVTTILGHIATS